MTSLNAEAERLAQELVDRGICPPTILDAGGSSRYPNPNKNGRSGHERKQERP